MIKSVYIENFKAIYRAANCPMEPFTVFIGNNGTGKSSIMEALRVLQLAIGEGLDKAFEKWGGLNRVRNYNAFLSKETYKKSEVKVFAPLTIGLTALVNERLYEYQVKINVSLDGIYYIVEHEELLCNSIAVFIANVLPNKTDGEATFYRTLQGRDLNWEYKANSLLLGYRNYSPSISKELEEFSSYVKSWQFLYLDAHVMGEPVTQNRLDRTIRLNYDGRNIADHLLWLKNQGQEYIDSLIRKMRFVLPYIKNIEPHVLEETINREVELLLQEASESEPLPGWLLSSGTLRILALLCMFDTPVKPPVLFIDEIENGLDPRTIGLLLSQIESEFAANEMQVIVTTHSPYFLDLIPLKNLIVAEKNQEGSIFHIPDSEESLKLWKERFSPGKLYTMGKLTN